MGNTQLTLQAVDQQRVRDLRARLLDEGEATRLSRQGQALSDPSRLALLGLLIDAGELCVSDACIITQREQGGVSRHLRILWDAGLVDKGRCYKNLFYWPTTEGERLWAGLRGE